MRCGAITDVPLNDQEGAGEIRTDAAKDALAEIVKGRLETAMAWKSSGCRIMGASVDEWISRMHNAYHKLHEPDEMAMHGGMMRAYFGLIQLKVDATHAWGKNQILNQRHYPFDILPTPNAELPDHLEKQAKYRFKLDIIKKLNESDTEAAALLSQGLDVVNSELAPILEEMMRAEKDRARKINYEIALRACKRHERLMRDQFVEGNWKKEYDKVLFDQCLMPFGAMAVQSGDVDTWGWNGNKRKRKCKFGHEFRHIQVEDAFHSPDSESAGDGSCFIERVKRTKHDLMMLRKSDAAVKRCIDDILDEMEGQEGDGVGVDIDMDDSRSNPLGGTYLEDDEVTCFRMAGELCGADLNGITGISVDDDDVVSCVIEICGDRTIYASFRPYAENMRGYFSSHYNGGTGDAAGISVGMKLWDTQRRLNRINFYSAANERMAHGPVIEQLTAAIEDGDSFEYAPWNVFQGVFSDTRQRALQMHQATPLWQQLYSQFYSYLTLADHESGIPAFAAYGARTGSVPTLGQEIIQHQGAAKGIQQWLERNDTYIIEPAVDHMYTYNLIHINDRSIQADARIHAKGALGALDSDIQAAQLTPALPQILQGMQIQGADGQPIVPLAAGQAAVNKWLTQFGLPTNDTGDSDVFGGELNVNTQPGLTIPRPDGRSGGGALPA